MFQAKSPSGLSAHHGSPTKDGVCGNCLRVRCRLSLTLMMIVIQINYSATGLAPRRGYSAPPVHCTRPVSGAKNGSVNCTLISGCRRRRLHFGKRRQSVALSACSVDFAFVGAILGFGGVMMACLYRLSSVAREASPGPAAGSLTEVFIESLLCGVTASETSMPPL